MKKNILLILIALFFSLQVFSQAPNWAWAKQVGGDFEEVGNSVAADINGNIVVTGYFTSPIVLIGTTLLFNAGQEDIFIVKYNAAGNVVWAKSGRGTNWEKAYSVAMDGSGNILLTGSSNSDTLIIGTDTISTTVPGSFLIKFSPLGNIIWSKTMIGGTCLAADSIGNFVLAGLFNIPVTFGSTTLPYSGGTGSDIFIVKFDSAGNALWAKSAGGIDQDEVTNLALDKDGNVFITGYYDDQPITFDTITLFNAGEYDLFIAKYDSMGNFKWARRAGGNSYDVSNGVAADPYGNVYITGGFPSFTITFGSTTFNNPAGQEELFLVKYDSSGNVIWAQARNYSWGTDIETDQYGNIIFSGMYEYYNYTIGSTTLIFKGGYDIFIAKIDSSGTSIWANGAAGDQSDYTWSICSDGLGNIITTGYFSGSTLPFGSTNLVNTNFGSYDMFVAKLENSTGEICLPRNKSDILLYPNPVQGNFILHYPGSSDKKFLELMDMDGRIVLKTTLPANISQQKINVENLSSGIYFVKVTDEKGFAQIRKFIVE